MKKVMLIAVAVLGAVCAQAFEPVSQVTSSVAIAAMPAVKSHLASLQEDVTIDTSLRGMFLIVR